MASVVCNFDREFIFEPGDTALLAIDMQRDFLDEEGYVAAVLGEDVSMMREIIPRFGAVLAAARDAGLFIVHTREGYLPDGSDMSEMKKARRPKKDRGPLGRFLIRGEKGQALIPELAPMAGEPDFDKPGFSAFYRTDLQNMLQARGIKNLILMGVTTQCCVHSTTRSAVDRGYRCLTVEDCCAAEEKSLHDNAVSLIYGENHLFGWVTQSDKLIPVLLP
jgi:nicotinamidase-related amidase